MKDQIRKQIADKRNDLSKEIADQLSKTIIQKLISKEEFQSSKNILFYISFQKEISTHDLIKKLIESKEKNVLVPYIEKDNPILQVSQLESFADLEKGMFGILEPKKEKRVSFDSEKIDLVLIPANVFDRTGHRIGYGRGYYDRFLKTLHHKPLKIGLAYDFQVVDKIPEEEHDVPVDIIVTEKEVIQIKN